MHIQHNQCAHQGSLEDVEVLSDDSDHLSDHFLHEVEEHGDTVGVALGLRDDGFGDAVSPFYQVDEEDALCGEGE